MYGPRQRIANRVAHLKCSPTDSLENTPTRTVIRMPYSSAAGNRRDLGAGLCFLPGAPPPPPPPSTPAAAAAAPGVDDVDDCAAGEAAPVPLRSVTAADGPGWTGHRPRRQTSRTCSLRGDSSNTNTN